MKITILIFDFKIDNTEVEIFKFQKFGTGVILKSKGINPRMVAIFQYLLSTQYKKNLKLIEIKLAILARKWNVSVMFNLKKISVIFH